MTKKQIVLGFTSAFIGLVIWKGSLFLKANFSIAPAGVYLPALCICSAIFGFIEPKKFYLWGILVIAPQIIVYMIETIIGKTDSMFGWGFGAISYMFFMIPSILFSFIGTILNKFIYRKM